VEGAHATRKCNTETTRSCRWIFAALDAPSARKTPVCVGITQAVPRWTRSSSRSAPAVIESTVGAQAPTVAGAPRDRIDGLLELAELWRGIRPVVGRVARWIVPDHDGRRAIRREIDGDIGRGIVGDGPRVLALPAVGMCAGRLGKQSVDLGLRDAPPERSPLSHELPAYIDDLTVTVHLDGVVGAVAEALRSLQDEPRRWGLSRGRASGCARLLESRVRCSGWNLRNGGSGLGQGRLWRGVAGGAAREGDRGQAHDQGEAAHRGLGHTGYMLPCLRAVTQGCHVMPAGMTMGTRDHDVASSRSCPRMTVFMQGQSARHAAAWGPSWNARRGVLPWHEPSLQRHEGVWLGCIRALMPMHHGSAS
jgi:hypothetical protein